MSDLDTELFIRRQIRNILLREEKEESNDKKEEEDKPKGRGQIFGGIGRGDIPKWVKEIFAGEDGSAAKAKRLASVNPGKLMSNLKAQRGSGKTTLERANSLVESVRNSNDSFKAAIGRGEEREDAGGRKGYFYSNAGLDQDRQSTLFVFDTVLAGSTVGYVEMSGHLRIEPVAGGSLMYNVVNNGDRWN